ncbi:MAG: 4Fe-4S cluster-binding domain-containing protein [Firmicutes bacterium]|nr:4Fe-4S cluster-binding domain-containing protein [Bacillota bacterium]
MGKINLQNLSLIVTNDCNLNCAHCMGGCKNSTDMNKDVIDTTLSQISSIHSLSICGGEPTLALESLNSILEFIKNNDIKIDIFNTTINGTIYSNDFLNIFRELNEYVDTCLFYISSDIYHDNEVKRLNLKKKYVENLIKYRKSEFYYGVRKLNKNLKLFNEGNAKNLDSSLTVDIKPIKVYLTYIDSKNKFDKNGQCYIGPMITINPEGIITEYEASTEHQNTIYNYGSVLEESIEENSLKRGRVLIPRKFDKATEKEMNRYNRIKTLIK